jgi:hypothetical protein
MKAFGDGEPLKPQPAKAGEQTVANATDKVLPTTPRRDICYSADFRCDVGNPVLLGSLAQRLARKCNPIRCRLD